MTLALRGHHGTRLLRSALSLESYGADELAAGPVLLAANHSTALDPAIVRAALSAADGRRTVVATTPGQVRRGLQQGRIVLVFPEGAPAADGELGDFAAVAVAPGLELGVPVVPVAVRGAYAAVAPGQRWPAPGRPRVSVRFARAVSGSAGEAEQVARAVRAAIAELLAEDATSWWQVQRAGGTVAAPEPVASWRRIWQHTQPPAAGERPSAPGIWRG